MTRLVVVADDLTGAADAGVAFAKRGRHATVWLDHLTATDVAADVVVVDMDSRAVTPAEAYARMHALLARLRPAPPPAIVKKIDSTLRGNTGPELRALLEALPGAFAIVCPALPSQGRTCRDGVSAVHGTPVDLLDFGRDIVSPVRDARIGAQLESPHVLLPLHAVRAGTRSLNNEIELARARGVRIAVADAETDEDLRALAALQHVRDDVLWVGSAGLLEMLAAELLPNELRAAELLANEVLANEVLANEVLANEEPARPCHPERQCHPELVEGCATIIIIGSVNDMTRRQIAAFAAHPEFHLESIAPSALLDGGAPVARSVARAAAAVARGTDTMIAVDARDAEAALALGRARGWDAHETSRRIREALVATADGFAGANGGGCVVLSGGDVARSFCERRGIRGLALLAEIAPGIPVSHAIGANLIVVTKAGGFGHPETYRDIVAALHAQVPR
jgi:uncharacterized protein YgbK (DUF1537 family)